MRRILNSCHKNINTDKQATTIRLSSIRNKRTRLWMYSMDSRVCILLINERTSRLNYSAKLNQKGWIFGWERVAHKQVGLRR